MEDVAARTQGLLTEVAGTRHQRLFHDDRPFTNPTDPSGCPGTQPAALRLALVDRASCVYTRERPRPGASAGVPAARPDPVPADHFPRSDLLRSQFSQPARVPDVRGRDRPAMPGIRAE